MKLIKIRKGNKYPRFFDILYFVLKWFSFNPVVTASFIMPNLDNSNRDPNDAAQDIKKLLGINLDPRHPSDYKSIQVGFRANHTTGKWDFFAYYNDPRLTNKFRFSKLASYNPNELGMVKLFPLSDTEYAMRFYRAGEPISEVHSHKFDSIYVLKRLSSTHYGGKDDNNDGIGDGYPGPYSYFEVKIDLQISPTNEDQNV